MNLVVESSLDKPPSYIYDFYLEKENHMLWMSNLNFVGPQTEQTVQVGSKTQLAFKIFEYRSSLKFIEEIIALEPPKHVKSKLYGKYFDISIQFICEEISKESTHIKSIIEYYSEKFWVRWFLKIYQIQIKKRHRKDLNNLINAINHMYEKV